MSHIFSKDYSVITFATNKLSYMQFAFNCAQSVLLFNQIQIYIVTNLDVDIPAKFQKQVHLIKVKPEHASYGLEIKIHLDEYLQTKNTLFIDADCLCFASLEPIFAACAKKDVSVAGIIVNAVEWCGPQQAKVIENEFDIKQLPRFNAGLIFLKQSPQTSKVFDFARNIIPNYDRYGFQRNNNTINEEGLIAIAMMANNETPIKDDGSYMTDLYTDAYPNVLNVLKGTVELKNPSVGNYNHRPWYPTPVYSPIIIHFGGNNMTSYIYRSQSLLLKLHTLGIPVNLATAFVYIFIYLPVRSIKWIISLLRNSKTS